MKRRGKLREGKGHQDHSTSRTCVHVCTCGTMKLPCLVPIHVCACGQCVASVCMLSVCACSQCEVLSVCASVCMRSVCCINVHAVSVCMRSVCGAVSVCISVHAVSALHQCACCQCVHAVSVCISVHAISVLHQCACCPCVMRSVSACGQCVCLGLRSHMHVRAGQLLAVPHTGCPPHSHLAFPAAATLGCGHVLLLL